MSFGVSGNNPYNYTFTTGSAQNAGNAQATDNAQTTGSAQTAGSTQNTVTYEPTAYVPDYQKEIDKALNDNIHGSWNLPAPGSASSADSAGSAGSAGAAGSAGSTGNVYAPTAEYAAQAARADAMRYANAYLNYCSTQQEWSDEGFSYNGANNYGISVTEASIQSPYNSNNTSNYIPVTVTYTYEFNGVIYTGTYTGGKSFPQN